MKTTLFALITAVLAVSACNKADNDVEAARQAETFPNGSNKPAHTTTTMPSASGTDTNRVGVDVDINKTKNGYAVNADGYRVDDRGQHIPSATGTLGDDVKAGANNAGVKVGNGVDDVAHSAGHASADAVATGHKADNGLKSDAIGDLDLGRTLNAKGDVADRTQQFTVGDAIVASVDADNLASGTALVATLKTKAGKVIATDKASISKGAENASFRLGTAKAAGDYVLTVSGPAGEIESQTFSVHN